MKDQVAAPSIDPVTLEILGHQFRAAAEEMGIALSRTARTTYVREAADFGTALATPAGKFLGAIIALIGIALFALPAGILSGGFIEELQRQKKSRTCPHCGKAI